MSEFWEKYRHPKWQKKKSKVMELASFACQECGNAEKTLNVHHRFYRKDADPWDYEDNELVCLCEDCHKEVTEKLRLVRELIGYLPVYALDEMLGMVKGMLASKRVVSEITFSFPDEDYGVARSLGIDFHDLREISEPVEANVSKASSDALKDLQWQAMERRIATRKALGLE